MLLVVILVVLVVGMSWLLVVRRHAVVMRVRLRVLPTIGLLLVVRHLLHLVYVLHLPLLHHILLMKGLHHSSIRIYHAHSVVGLLVLVRQHTQRLLPQMRLRSVSPLSHVTKKKGNPRIRERHSAL